MPDTVENWCNKVRINFRLSVAIEYLRFDDSTLVRSTLI